MSDVTGTAPTCAVATIGGVNPRGGNSRCADNNRLACDEPFVADQDDCGGEISACYLAQPERASVPGVPLCLVQRLSADITGTWNVDTASLKTAKACVRFMSKRHITAYAVAVEDGVPVGHVAYGCGRQTEIAGRVR